MIDIGYSQTAKRLKINNTPTQEAINNSKIIISKIIQPLEQHFKKTLNISSFYRSPFLNKQIGGATNSQHLKGQAIDFTIGGISNHEIFNYIKAYLPYDQLILESSWIHISLKNTNNRKEIL